MINVTSRNISQWLVKSRPQYFKRRYGGIIYYIGIASKSTNGRNTYFYQLCNCIFVIFFI